MKTFKLFQWLIILVIILVAVPGAAASVPQGPADSARFQESSGGVESLRMSYVWGDPGIGGDKCTMRHVLQTFCFTADSYTDDWDYVYRLYMRFPDDWTVHDVYLQGTPSCSNGGTFGDFSWSPLASNEVQIDHSRYHANPIGFCSADYCFEVTSGSGVPPGYWFVPVSWYWLGSGYGSPPYYPCSRDGYTPTGQPACDSMTSDFADIQPCPRTYLPFVFKGY